MAEIRIKIDGKIKKFAKKEYFIEDNITALKFSLKQEEYLALEKPTIEDVIQNQKNFAEFIVEIFGNEFTADDYIKGGFLEDKKIAENAYILCMGGKVDDKEEKKDPK